MRADFGPTSADYGRHRKGFPPTFFERVRELGIGLAGQRVLDVGSGTGAIARPLAARGCAVTALDVSAPMLAESRRLCGDGPRPSYLFATVSSR